MKQLSLRNLTFFEDAAGERWLLFRTEDKSSCALNINREFAGDRVVHEIIRTWAKEQDSL